MRLVVVGRVELEEFELVLPLWLGVDPLILAVEAPRVDALAMGQPRRGKVPFFPVAVDFGFGLLATMSVETSSPSLSLGLGLGLGLSLVAEEDSVVGFSAVESTKNGPSMHSAHSSQSRRVKRSTCGKEGALRPPRFSSRRCGVLAAASLFESAGFDHDERDSARGSSAGSRLSFLRLNFGESKGETAGDDGDVTASSVGEAGEGESTVSALGTSEQGRLERTY